MVNIRSADGWTFSNEPCTQQRATSADDIFSHLMWATWLIELCIVACRPKITRVHVFRTGIRTQIFLFWK
ncbi:hypothetical protein BRADI_1g62672v3 [Brachypodium distachyon]|uniref:Uncharacterized protein n=1 Tax=Brachypodium distachyon TaxID=15368 RepID=A0A2K2DT22_BRADI|nr:hypothetical protein BRADI_1g62672v3 [Brachypodium distachyon]